ncbi:MAG: hypothetical protein J0G94_14270 [Sphingomonadales bacterium]|nr:hypothetical protein [Sphingomonadales bacterium]
MSLDGGPPERLAGLAEAGRRLEKLERVDKRVLLFFDKGLAEYATTSILRRSFGPKYDFCRISTQKGETWMMRSPRWRGSPASGDIQLNWGK